MKHISGWKKQSIALRLAGALLAAAPRVLPAAPARYNLQEPNSLLGQDIYDLLTQHPRRTLELIYRFIGEPWFEHDFDNVEYSENEFDQNLGVKGLHDVKKKVAFKPRRSILPPDLFAKYQEMDFWQDQTGTSASIVAPRRANVQDTRINKDTP